MIDNIIARIILFPFSVLYGLAIGLRNLLYDLGILRSTKFNIPVISVGNLAIGGTGKTPHIEYLLRLLKNHINVAVLSRGYKRKTKGFRFVNPKDNAEMVGDEPLQFKFKFRDVVVAVSESRMTGVPEIIKHYPQTQGVLLDDAFQHRSVIPGLNILLTAYQRVYTEDWLLPAGRLREYASAAERANIVVVTKCPPDMDAAEKQVYADKLKLTEGQQLFFSHYQYFEPYYLYDFQRKANLHADQKVVLLSAIANLDYLEDYLDRHCDLVQTIRFEDHHYFTEREMFEIQKILQAIDDPNTIIITTEKDAIRLDLFRKFLLDQKMPLYVLPIEVNFHFNEGPIFEEAIKDFFLNFTV